MPNSYNMTPDWTYRPPYSTWTPGGYSGTAYPPRRPAPSNIIRVSGPESANAYPVGPNQTVLLMDVNEPIFYIKSADDSGFPSPLRRFRFEEIFEAEPKPAIEVPPVNYATKDDIDMIKEQIAAMGETLKGLM